MWTMDNLFQNGNKFMNQWQSDQKTFLLFIFLYEEQIVRYGIWARLMPKMKFVLFSRRSFSFQNPIEVPFHCIHDQWSPEDEVSERWFIITHRKVIQCAMYRRYRRLKSIKKNYRFNTYIYICVDIRYICMMHIRMDWTVISIWWSCRNDNDHQLSWW